ncbi:MAG TPA: zf-HC2 domain-containing protein [Candidatus Krumholzibacteria bacterium]|nr:zf-HC2 domain-containing protein [Candidatus Krumholzibacteria bacterium]
MECTRYQTDGMRLLDDELSLDERREYESHVRECDTCRRELAALGRVVGLTNRLKLRVSDDAFWETYWQGVYRRTERRAGFIFLIGGVIALLLYLLYRALRSPQLWTFEGISVAVILLGLVVLFISVARERYHEHKSDPYREVER